MTDPGRLDGRCILQVLPALDPGGAERGAVDMAAAIVRAGGTALVASAGGRLEAELAAAGGESVPMPLDSKNPAVMAANGARLGRLIRDRRVDLVHARSRAPAWSAYGVVRQLKVPFVTTFHAAYNFGDPLKKFYNSVMAKGDRVIAISHFIADHVRDRYAVGPDRLRTIHRGIDMTRFDPDTVDAGRVSALRTLYDLPEGPPLALMPGRLSRPKGHEVLLDALARCSNPDLRVLIVGPDGKDYRHNLEAMVRRLGLASRVRIADVCPDLPAAYAMADVVVIASTQPEGFGRTAVEAQAMGRPVIATGIGALPELVEPGETGWLVPPGDAAALADALDQAISLGRIALRRMGERAREAVRPRFGLERMTGATLDVYGELLGQVAGRGAG